MPWRFIASLPFALCTAAVAQQPPVQPAKAHPSPVAGFVVHTGRIGDCIQSEIARKLKGNDLIDDRQICFAVARLDCLKQAVGNKIYGAARSDFVRSCAGQ